MTLLRIGDCRLSARRSALVDLGGEIRFLGGFETGVGGAGAALRDDSGANFRKSSLFGRLDSVLGGGFISLDFDCVTSKNCFTYISNKF